MSATKADRNVGTGWMPTRADIAWTLLMTAVITALVTRHFLLGLSRFPPLSLGPLQLTPFGPLMMLNIFFGFYLVRRWCLRFELDWRVLSAGLGWIVLGGYYISHWVSIALYFPDLLTDVAALLNPRGLISSFGGMYGGGLLAVLYLRRVGLPVWRHMDALVYGFVGGYVFGRAGCFAIHDHPGRVTDFFLGVEMNGIVRHDLGFYEMWLMLGLLILLTLLASNGRPPDALPTAVALSIYAPVRFAFDALRVADPIYAGLTPGQWFCIPTLALALAAWWQVAQRSRAASGE